MRVNLTKEWCMAAAEREGDADPTTGKIEEIAMMTQYPPDFYAPVKDRDFVEMTDEREAHDLWAGLMETFVLPEGVHYLSAESQATFDRIRAKSEALKLALSKRGP